MNVYGTYKKVGKICVFNVENVKLELKKREETWVIVKTWRNV